MKWMLCLVMCVACLGLACEKAQAPQVEARFPWSEVRASLDQAPKQAEEVWTSRFPGSRREEGSFARFGLVGSEILEEVTLFQDVRSGRVNTVIVKYKADLGVRDRAQVLKELGAEAITQKLDSQEVTELVQGPLLLRARRQDRFGRLTITVEAAPDPSKGPGE